MFFIFQASGFAFVFLNAGLGMQANLLNWAGPLGGAGESLTESMELAAAVTSGGPGPFAFGLNECTSSQGLGPMDECEDQGGQNRSTKELEVITVASMQTPCRCTNSYAYL